MSKLEMFFVWVFIIFFNGVIAFNILRSDKEMKLHYVVKRGEFTTWFACGHSVSSLSDRHEKHGTEKLGKVNCNSCTETAQYIDAVKLKRAE